MSIQLKPLAVADLPVLQAAAAADNHGVLYPTHGVWKNGELVGYLSVCATPIVNVWVDSRRMQALDSVRALNQLDDYLRFQGRQNYIMPCARESPFFPHMKRLGFAELGENVWHTKLL